MRLKNKGRTAVFYKSRLGFHLCFSILSIIYIAGIFILPRVIPGSIISKIWNPFSLLHIPMYGVLMLLLTLSFWPDLSLPKSGLPIFSPLGFPGAIASLVGILDEIQQVYIPGREASATDVMLDVLGVVLMGILIYYKTK